MWDRSISEALSQTCLPLCSQNIRSRRCAAAFMGRLYTARLLSRMWTRSGPEVGFGEITIDLLEARFWIVFEFGQSTQNRRERRSLLRTL